MGQGPSNRAGAVVSGAQWHDGRRALQILRRCGLSWTRISKLLGLDPGWAKSVFESKHVMTVEQLAMLAREINKLQPVEVEAAMRHLDGEPTEADAVSFAATTSRAAEAAARLARANGLARRILSTPGCKWKEVATAFGYASGSSAQTSLRTSGNIPAYKSDAAERWLAARLNEHAAPAVAAPAPGPAPDVSTANSRPAQPAVARAAQMLAPPTLSLHADTWEAIRDGLLGLTDRVRTLAQGGGGMAGLPVSVRREVEAALIRRHDKLIALIAEEFDL